MLPAGMSSWVSAPFVNLRNHEYLTPPQTAILTTYTGRVQFKFWDAPVLIQDAPPDVMDVLVGQRALRELAQPRVPAHSRTMSEFHTKS